MKLTDFRVAARSGFIGAQIDADSSSPNLPCTTFVVQSGKKTSDSVGIFDDKSGEMWFKSDFSGVSVDAGEAITFTVKVKIE